MKAITKVLLFGIILALFSANDVSAMTKSHKKIVEFIEDLKPSYMIEEVYRLSNDYNEIKDSDTRQKIKYFCKFDCISKNCGNLGAQKKIGVACQVMCPKSNIQSCLSKVS